MKSKRKKTFRKKTFRKKTFRKKIYRKKKFRNLKGGATEDEVWNYITKEATEMAETIRRKKNEIQNMEENNEVWFNTIMERVASSVGHDYTPDKLLQMGFNKAKNVDNLSWRAGQNAQSNSKAFRPPEGTIDAMTAWRMGYLDAHLGVHD